MSSNLNMLVIVIHFYRFTSLIGAILIGLTLIWFGLKTYGLSRTLMDHQTPLIKELSQIENIQWQKYDPENLSSRYFYIDLFYENEKWHAGSPNKSWFITELLTNNPESYFIFNVQLSDNKHTAKLKSLIDKGEYWKRIIFTAPVENTLDTFRELSPRWTFTSGPMFLIRFTTLGTLKLESLMDIKADVLYISTKSTAYVPNLNALINEAVRQKKYILIGPVPKPWDEEVNIGWVIDSTE